MKKVITFTLYRKDLEMVIDTTIRDTIQLEVLLIKLMNPD